MRCWHPPSALVMHPPTTTNARDAANLVNLVEKDNAALGGLDVKVAVLQQLEDDRLDILAHIACLCQHCAVADGKRHVQDARQRPSQQCFP